MKRVWVPLVAIAIATGIWFVCKPSNHVGPVSATTDNPATATSENLSSGPGTTNVSATVPAATSVVSTQTVAAAAVVAATPAPPAAAISTLPPSTVLDNARVVMHNYAGVFGENPVGDNSEITAALTGKNPKQVNFIAEESGLRVNGKGELIDAWGTPFFFHQLSSKVMEIRSAGADKKLWTLDDQVTR